MLVLSTYRNDGRFNASLITFGGIQWYKLKEFIPLILSTILFFKHCRSVPKISLGEHQEASYPIILYGPIKLNQA